MRRDRRGFTLMELIIVILIIGVLASMAVPQYLRTVEVGKFDDATAMVNMIGTTNRMFALDHNGFYTTGQFTAACGTTACPTSVTATQTNPCVLVWCRYLTDQDWANRPWDFFACNGSAAGSCSGIGSGNLTAVGRRKTTAASPYSTWQLMLATNGTITSAGTDVPTPTY